ncbi:pleiotropic drug resistance protein [Salix suchowensis]|nr:pleiotropic drug resistance protein [Salix suchowensis]
MELTTIGRNAQSSFRRGETGLGMDADSIMEEDDEVRLQWAAIERLPTFKRIKTSLFEASNAEGDEGKTVTDVTKLGAAERRLFIEKLLKHVENDNLRLLQNLRERIDRVGMKLPTVEVRYKNLSVEAECEVVDGKPLPTIWNSIATFLSPRETKISILKDVSGIIKPSRLTLLLGPPGCGKTTLLLALSGRLDQSLKLDEFVPQKTSAYISQYDLHIPEMTVRETIDFSAHCQGVGSRADIILEVSRREKEAGIVPDPDIDTYMKATSAEGQRRNLQTDYVLKILGLDICADIMVGNAMRRGISGGQKKRLTTGEMIVGPTKALFMDEISTGYSSTTFQIVTCLQQLVHITDSTALISLLQPAPETFNLFDDVILMAEGKIVYHGPCSHALQFFEDCGFKCPQRKGAADFLQEVISKKDQAQYWCHADIPYHYVSVNQFIETFKASNLGQKLAEELSKPYEKSRCPNSAVSFSFYSVRKWELFKACMAREVLLMKRNTFVYVFKTAQLVFTAFITMTVFLRARMTVDLMSANYLMGSMYYALIRLSTNGVAELSLTIIRLPAVQKQRLFYLYPAWAYSIPASILKIPFSALDSILWTGITYYVIGYSPELTRFLCQFLLLFALHLASTSMCRFIASIFQTMVLATTVGSLILVLMFLFGGFILPRPSLPPWLRWGFWIFPMTYGEIGISLNEFLSPRWKKMLNGNTTMGDAVLISHGLNFKGYFYWISLGALFGFTILFDLGFILALTYFKPPKMSKAIISKKRFSQLQGREDEEWSRQPQNESISALNAEIRKTDDGLPFVPLTMTFKDVQYFVDTPPEMRGNGFNEKKLQLLSDITGAFKPGVLTALMGVSGAGKTTLMDVLSGRKTGGIIEGDIRIGGYPKITVEESIVYSAWLRLPPEIDEQTKSRFVEEVIETIELQDIKFSLVGIPGRSGLSTEQRKRLTIAVELVSNPSIIFMDEPTSGLDARAAAIVMRAVKNVVSTGRTTVCTIHQPSIDVFEAFDELILMKRGGMIIYSGVLGHHSCKLIEYFEIKDNYNPATWMLEVTSASMESELELDFAQLYKESTMYQETIGSVQQLNKPPPGSRDLQFSTPFPQNRWQQYIACLWKQHLSYWRSPEYNLTRYMFMIVSSLLFGIVFWQKGREINNEQDLINILGLMYIAVIFLGINNCSTVIPYVATERTVLYREKFAAMYSPWAYSFAQVTMEIPYVLLQAFIYVAITYPTIGYYWSASKVFWYFYATFCTFLYFVFLGMLLVSITPSVEVASILSTTIYTILNLFSGFLLPGKKIPKLWIWCYYLCPTSWSLYGFLTSQYGDIDKEILIFGELKTISSFLEDYYGFRHDHLGIVAVVLGAFPVAFAFLFAYCIGKSNFQR